ncbi:MAG: phosphonate ABC transporter ATP-binding protein [Nitrososphaeraceae archaeon]
MLLKSRPSTQVINYDHNSRLDIKLNGISVKASEEQLILDDIKLEIKKGDMIAILGQSGAGKSTLLRVIAGLIKPFQNSVMFNNINFFSLKKKQKLVLRRKIGYIPQQFKLIKELNVFENVMVGRLGYLSKISSILRKYPENDKKIVLDSISKVGLMHRKNVPVKRLSGGEQQRVAIARCLAQEPLIILADEPMASLDSSLAKNILEILHNANKEDGKTVVFVIHDIEIAFKYAKRIILLKNGQIKYDGSVNELEKDIIKSIF